MKWLYFTVLFSIVYSRSLLSTPNNRIVGGSQSTHGFLPYLVAIYFDTDSGTFFCGGTLIDPKWVLTAGHCVYGAKVFTLHLGSVFLELNDVNKVTVAATFSVLHPDFNDTTLENNIGLIRIDTNYTANAQIQPIRFNRETLTPDEIAVASGWGATGDWDGVATELNLVYLKIISNEACRAVYGSFVNDNVVCSVGFLNANQGVCTGDIGGPLIQFSSNFSTSLVGVISFGGSPTGCSTTNPSGFVRVVPYLEWIADQTGILI